MTKEGGRAMAKASKQLEKMLIGALTPWANAHEKRREYYKKKYGIVSGEIAIIDSGDGVAQQLNAKGVRVVKGK